MGTCVRSALTSQGSPYSRFRRALLTKNPVLIDAAARELAVVGLDDALRILIVFAERRDRRFQQAAAKFAARVIIERGLSPAQAHRVLALAESLPSSPDTIGQLLRRYCEPAGGGRSVDP
jgi:hypothetical protein